MSSVIHYRFKAGSAEWSRIAFEGHAMTLGELKRAIAEQRKLTPQQQQMIGGAAEGGAAGVGRMLQDFELILTNVDTGEEYYGDQTSIAKNASVIVKRVPSQRSKTLRLEASEAARECEERDGFSIADLCSFTLVVCMRACGRFLCLCSEQPDLPFSPVGTARAASSTFTSPALKRPRIVQATDAIEELHRRTGLSLGLGGQRGSEEFGDDPLDEWSYVQREEEQKAAAAKERAAREAAAAKEAAAAQAAAAQQQSAAAAAAPAQPVGAPGHYGLTPVNVPGLPAVYVRPPPNRPPPPNYVCHNCKKPGHWKQSCPTASHLSAPTVNKIVQQQQQMAALIYAPRIGAAPAPAPAFSAQAALLGALSARPHVAQPVAPATPTQNGAPSGVAPTAPELLCTLCNKLFDHPMVVPCCFTSFCDECIRQALVLESSRCPRCHSDAISADQLKPNNVMQKRVLRERERLAGGASGGAGAPPQIQQPTQQQHAMPAVHAQPPVQRRLVDDDDYSVQRR